MNWPLKVMFKMFQLKTILQRRAGAHSSTVIFFFFDPETSICLLRLQITVQIPPVDCHCETWGYLDLSVFNILLQGDLCLASDGYSLISFPDPHRDITNQFCQSPSEGGLVWCLCGGPQDPANTQWVSNRWLQFK